MGDTRAVDQADRLDAALREAFAVFMPMIQGARTREGQGYRVVSAPSFPIALANAVWVDGPDEAPAIADLASSLEEVRARGVAPAVVVRSGLAPGVEEEAGRLGLTTVERMPGMALTSERFRPPPGPSPELVPVGEDEALLAVAQDVTARGFEAPPELFDGLFASKMRAEGLDLWIAFVDGEPVSTALGHVTGHDVGIFNVGTPPEHRRKGYGGWATARAVERGFELGASFAYLQSSEMGFRVYQRLGFEQVCEYLLLTDPGAHTDL